MTPIHQSGRKIYGRVYYSRRELHGSGWVLQYFDSGQLCSIDLGIEVKAAVLAAVADAADFLSCRPENIQVADQELSLPDRDLTVEVHRSALERARSMSTPCARVYFARDDVLVPGWYVQFQSQGRLDRHPLWQKDPTDAEAARTEAAWLLGCHPDEVEVGGELLDWPKPRKRRG